MIIYNSKEIASKYMAQDDFVIEIRSQLSIEEMLQKLRDGKEITPEIANIAAFKVGDGVIKTYEDVYQSKEANFPDKMSVSINTALDHEEFEDLSETDTAKQRPKLLQAFEAFQFNRPWRGFDFVQTQIDSDILRTQLFSAVGIMPTLQKEQDLDINELKRLSLAGDKLYWDFARIGEANYLPSKEEIDVYLSLNDYEKKIFNQLRFINPRKFISVFSQIKSESKEKVFSQIDMNYVGRYDINNVVNLIDIPFYSKFDINAAILDNKKMADLAVSLRMDKKEGFLPVNTRSDFEIDSKLTEFQITKDSDKTNKTLYFEIFCTELYKELVLPEECYQKINSSDKVFFDTLKAEYKKLYEEEFLPKFTKEDGTVFFTREDIVTFAKKNYIPPMPTLLKRAEKFFKELYRGHAPKILKEYMEAQFAIRGISKDDTITDEVLHAIAEEFNQKNVSKIAKFKNKTLFALSTKLNYNEIKEDHIQAIGVYLNYEKLKGYIEKGFLEWYLAHKDTNVSELVELFEIIDKVKRFDVNKSAKDITLDIKFQKARADASAMESRYRYKFADNELAIRGRHIVAQQGNMKMYMLQADDYRNFTVGYDTHCCQHYGNAGESCVWKATSDPFAGVVVIERNGEILAQAFTWTDESKDTLVFDNMEFANDRDVKQFTSLIAAWCAAMPYKNIHMGMGYNTLGQGFGKPVTAEEEAKLPVTTGTNPCRNQYADDGVDIYTDYHVTRSYGNKARALKKEGMVLIKTSSPVRISKDPDEPTRWDILARPETSFLLNDYHNSIESRLEFARNFLNEQTPEIQMEAVKRNLQAIRFINHPTEEVQKYVIERNPDCAPFIKSPCVAVQKILVDKDPSYIRKIDTPSEEMAIEAVKENGLLLGVIENPSERTILMAIEQNGYAIRFVPSDRQTEEMQIAAIKSNPKVVSLITASELVQKEAIKLDPHVIGLIENPSDSLQKFAVEKNPGVINEIKNPTYNAIKKAVEKNGLMIRNFQFAYPHLREVALRQNGYAINALKEPTNEEFLIAVKQNPSILRTIKDPVLRSNLELAMNRREQTGANMETEDIELD